MVRPQVPEVIFPGRVTAETFPFISVRSQGGEGGRGGWEGVAVGSPGLDGMSMRGGGEET